MTWRDLKIKIRNIPDEDLDMPVIFQENGFEEDYDGTLEDFACRLEDSTINNISRYELEDKNEKDEIVLVNQWVLTP